MQGPAFFGLAGSEGTDGRSIHDRSADVLMHTSRGGSGNGVLRQERLSAVRYAPRAPRRDDPVKGPKRRPARRLLPHVSLPHPHSLSDATAGPRKRLENERARLRCSEGPEIDVQGTDGDGAMDASHRDARTDT